MILRNVLGESGRGVFYDTPLGCVGTLNITTYLLTYSMVQNPSWEAKWFAASQEIPRISRNPNVHYRTHKRPPTVSILGQPNPVHIPTFHILDIHPNITHPSTSRSPQWSLSFRFPQQDTIHCPFLTPMNITTENLSYSFIVVGKHIQLRITQKGVFWRRIFKVVLKHR